MSPGDEGAVELAGQLLRLLGKIAGQSQHLRNLAAVMRHHASRRVNRERHDLLWGIVSDLLDVHAAFRGDDEGDTRGLAINQHRQIELFGNVRTVFNVETIDLLAGRTGLHR